MPVKPRKTKKMIYLPEPLANRLRREAFQRHISQSGVVVAALKAFFDATKKGKGS